MTRKKLKITIESEGQTTQVLEAYGIAAALIDDGEDADHHGLKCLICGRMNLNDLLHLHDGVGGELIEQLENVLLRELSPADILRAITNMRGENRESEGQSCKC